jgi:hypothetical protein
MEVFLKIFHSFYIVHNKTNAKSQLCISVFLRWMPFSSTHRTELAVNWWWWAFHLITIQDCAYL